MFGFLNVYKPSAMTSHDVVAVLRRVIKIKQIGHTGTLDPFAAGVLPVCIGKATRLIEYLPDDKAYSGTIQLGKSTTTYDIEGEGVNFSDKKARLEEIEEALKSFRGEIEQLPPVYSAIKVKGKKLYEYAREGKEVEITPRRVTIARLEIIDFDFEKQQVSLHIECSKGTYIRSIAHDLGVKTGAYAYLAKLIRTQAGKFRLKDTIKLENQDCFTSDRLINPLDVLDLPQVPIEQAEMEKIRHGQPLKNRKFKNNQSVILVYNDNVICAVGMTEYSQIKVKKVFI